MQGKILKERYLITKMIGKGAYGVVWMAKDAVLQRNVAIKQLFANHASPRIKQRFQNEGLVLAQLNHPRVVSIFDVFEEQDVHYIVMECCMGGSLSKFLKHRSALSVDEVVTIIHGLADALKIAHASKIIHRDVKPSNILICDTQGGLIAKLSDFGVARVPTMNETILTQEGEIVGTPEYASPEQIQGLPATDKSDVYSLAAVMTFLLTGQHYLFEGHETRLERCTLVLQKAPTLSETIPQHLRDLLQDALAKKASERPTIGQFIQRLDPDYVAPRFSNLSTLTRADDRPVNYRNALVISLLTIILFGSLIRFGYITAAASEPTLSTTVSEEATAPPTRMPTAAVAVILSDTVGLSLPEPTTIEESAEIASNTQLIAYVVGTEPEEGLRLRQQPNLDGEVLGVLPPNQRLVVNEFSEDELWAYVTTEADGIRNGWVYVSYLVFENMP